MTSPFYEIGLQSHWRLFHVTVFVINHASHTLHSTLHCTPPRLCGACNTWCGLYIVIIIMHNCLMGRRAQSNQFWSSCLWSQSVILNQLLSPSRHNITDSLLNRHKDVVSGCSRLYFVCHTAAADILSSSMGRHDWGKAFTKRASLTKKFSSSSRCVHLLLLAWHSKKDPCEDSFALSSNEHLDRHTCPTAAPLRI